MTLYLQLEEGHLRPYIPEGVKEVYTYGGVTTGYSRVEKSYSSNYVYCTDLKALWVIFRNVPFWLAGWEGKIIVCL